MVLDNQNRLTRRRLIALGAGAIAAWRYTMLAGSQPDNGYTFAVLGLDTRAEDANQRADTIMVSRVDFDALTVRTLSIPRDLYVEIPDYGYGKINDAYQRGLASDPELKWQAGAEVMLATIRYNFGVICDGVAVIELRRLPELIDAVGGIEVVNPYDVYVKDFPHFSEPTTSTLDFPAGPIALDGASAMDFVRTRQQDGDGGRVMRQHLVLAALLEKLQQPEMIPKIPELVQTLSDIVHTDIPGNVQMALIAAVPQIPPGNLAFMNIESLLTPGYSAEGAWIYQGDWSTLPSYVQAWLSGGITS